MTIRQLISNYAANTTIMFQCDAFMQKSYFIDTRNLIENDTIHSSDQNTYKIRLTCCVNTNE